MGRPTGEIVVDVVSSLLWATGIAALASGTLAQKGRFALMFHGKSPNIPAEGQPRLSIPEFEKIVTWVAKRFSFLTPEEFSLGRRPGVLMTFDDGFANNARNVLPVLHRHALPGLFFVSTQHVTNPSHWLGFVRQQAEKAWGTLDAVPPEVAADWYDGMSLEELREFAGDPLVTIGSHGVTHAILTECDDEQLDFELSRSRQLLQDWTSGPIDYLAYPRGDYDRRVAGRVQEAGYRHAFTIESSGLGLERFEIPRVGIYRAGAPYLGMKLSGLHRKPLRLVVESNGPGPA